MKFTKKTYMSTNEILATKNFEALGVMVDDAGIEVGENGLKIVAAGTVVGGKTKPTLTNENEVVVKKEDGDAEGVLLHDVDVTHGPGVGTMVIRGQIDLNKIEAPNALSITALSSRILFIK